MDSSWTSSERVIRSYKMILKFFGLALADERTGRVERDTAPAERLDNLNTSPHNFLRISRIITSLGELGFQRYKAPLLQRLRAEIDNGALANARQSCLNFWAPLVEAEDSVGYRNKTLEEPEDREDGVLFKPGGRLA